MRKSLKKAWSDQQVFCWSGLPAIQSWWWWLVMIMMRIMTTTMTKTTRSMSTQLTNDDCTGGDPWRTCKSKQTRHGVAFAWVSSLFITIITIWMGEPPTFHPQYHLHCSHHYRWGTVKLLSNLFVINIIINTRGVSVII